MSRRGPRTPRQWRRTRRSLVGVALAGLGFALAGLYLAGVILFALAVLGLLLVETARLGDLIVEAQRQNHALVQVRPLLGELPVNFSGWSADPVTVHNIVRLLIDTRPHFVFECGSGSSTVVVAHCLRLLTQGRLVSLEHDPTYAERTREMLRHRGIHDVATVVTAPLVDREVNGQMVRWYGPQYLPLITEPIDVLLVDGPPGPSGPLARLPAIPLLKPHLAPGCFILLDDGDRADERAIAHAWAQELGAKLSYLQGGRGGWLLSRLGVSE